jgi:hypothetical protein
MKRARCNEELTPPTDKEFKNCPFCGEPLPKPEPEPAPPPVTPPAPASVKAGGKMQFGGYDWLVLEVSGGKALLLSERVLEERVYHNTETDITWEKCGLRAYLNGEFYNRFSASDRARVIETRVVNNNNPWYGTNGGNTTLDRIFLLSLEEVARYFGDSGKLRRAPTDEEYGFYDQYDSAREAYDMNGETSWWWLRSPGDDGDGAADVSFDGFVDVGGVDVSDDYGVRPALWLSTAEQG